MILLPIFAAVCGLFCALGAAKAGKQLPPSADSMLENGFQGEAGALPTMVVFGPIWALLYFFKKTFPAAAVWLPRTWETCSQLIKNLKV